MIQTKITNVRIGGSAIANPRRKIRVADTVGGTPTDVGDTDGELGSDILWLTNYRYRKRGRTHCSETTSTTSVRELGTSHGESEHDYAMSCCWPRLRSEYSRLPLAFKQLSEVLVD